MSSAAPDRAGPLVTATTEGWTVSGEIDSYTAPLIAARIRRDRRLDDGVRLAVDLSAVRFIDSTGLTIVLDLVRDQSLAGRSLFVCRPSPAVVRLLEILENHDPAPWHRPAMTRPSDGVCPPANG